MFSKAIIFFKLTVVKKTFKKSSLENIISVILKSKKCRFLVIMKKLM